MALHTHPFTLRQGKRRPPGGDGVVYLPFMYRLLLLGYNNKKKEKIFILLPQFPRSALGEHSKHWPHLWQGRTAGEGSHNWTALYDLRHMFWMLGAFYIKTNTGVWNGVRPRSPFCSAPISTSPVIVFSPWDPFQPSALSCDTIEAPRSRWPWGINTVQYKTKKQENISSDSKYRCGITLWGPKGSQESFYRTKPFL